MIAQSHRGLSFEERSRLCRCLNYEKLSFEVCKELAKNPKIPPKIAVQALISQKSKIPTKDHQLVYKNPSTNSSHQMVLKKDINLHSFSKEDKDHMKLSLQRMQRRAVELEKACMVMNGQMSEMVRHNRNFPRLCWMPLPFTLTWSLNIYAWRCMCFSWNKFWLIYLSFCDLERVKVFVWSSLYVIYRLIDARSQVWGSLRLQSLEVTNGHAIASREFKALQHQDGCATPISCSS